MWSLVHGSVAIPSLVIRTVSLSRVDVNTASKNWPRDKRVFPGMGIRHTYGQIWRVGGILVGLCASPPWYHHWA